jgi:hypothetical protein
MKKYLLIILAALLTTAVVTATVAGSKTVAKKENKCTRKKSICTAATMPEVCPSHCAKADVACP